MASPQEYETPITQRSSKCEQLTLRDRKDDPAHLYQVLEPTTAESPADVYVNARNSAGEDSGMYTSVSHITNSTRVQSTSPRADISALTRLSSPLLTHDYRYSGDSMVRLKPSTKESKNKHKPCPVVLACLGGLVLIIIMVLAITALVVALIRNSDICECQLTDVNQELSQLLTATNETQERLAEMSDLVTECERKVTKATEDIHAIKQALENVDEATIQINTTFSESIQALQDSVRKINLRLTEDMLQSSNCTTLVEETCTFTPGVRSCTTGPAPYQKPEQLAVDVTCKTLGGREEEGARPLVTRAIINNNTIACQCNRTVLLSDDSTAPPQKCGLCVTRCV